MYAGERRLKIAQMVKERQIVSVAELAETFGVTKSTIRRDLHHLAQRNILDLMYGEAVLRNFLQAGAQPSVDRLYVNQAEKMTIGKMAARFVNQGETVFIDSGTTTLAMAESLKTLDIRCVAVTTSIEIACVFEDVRNITVVLTGGVMRDRRHSLLGDFAERAIKQININKAFIGANGVTINEGVMSYNPIEARLRRTIVERAQEVVLLADHTKFGRLASVAVVPLSKLDYVMTSSMIPPLYSKYFKGTKCRLLLCDVPESLAEFQEDASQADP